jgi:hypothetical protein
MIALTFATRCTMNKNLVVPMLAALLALPVLAQSPNPYDGTWTVTFEGAKTAGVEGTVVVKNDGGTWKVLSRDRKDPCVGRETPIAVKTASADELVFEVTRSKIMTGCRDFTMKFKKVDDKTLAGQTTDGRPISMTKH